MQPAIKMVRVNFDDMKIYLGLEVVISTIRSVKSFVFQIYTESVKTGKISISSIISPRYSPVFCKIVNLREFLYNQAAIPRL
jgi:hypothetical protein